ncbi:MAG TPA: methylmalonyl-CoA epimerase [Bacteroidetes bacterium]|nr:methylmalonyl-CoA epimerase [Bacteroidota bacterium]
MIVSKIEHIGIAVRNLQEAGKFYEQILGLECYREETVKDQKVRTAFYMAGNLKIELLEPTSQDSPIAKFIEKRGEGIHHIAFETKDLPKVLDKLDNKQIRLIDRHPRLGAEGLQIAFLHPASTHGVLLELCEACRK